MMGHSRASWAGPTGMFQGSRAQPAMKESAVVRIREALVFAARAQQIVRYRDFHAFFEGGATLRKQFELLDRIVHELANPADVDYGSRMANSQGLPGPEFLRR